MSLVVAVAGQYREYDFPNSKMNKKIDRAQKTDNENDLILDEEYEREKEKKKNQKKSHPGLNQYTKTNEKIKVRRENIFARDIMSSSVKSIHKGMKAKEALDLMRKYHYRHFPVVEDNKIIGIVSDRDLLMKSGLANFSKIELSSLVTDEVIVAKEETEIKIIARIMIYEEIGALPIINKEYEVVGIVTKSDILKCVMDNMRFDVLV